MRKKISLVILMIVLCFSAGAEGKKSVYKGFSGGMMLHAGYLSGCDNPMGYRADGITKGIGGAAKVHLWKNFRVGTEGYVSTLPMHKTEGLSKGSHIKYGWGGLLADFYWELGRFTPFVGLTVGGGSQKDLYITGGDRMDWLPEEQTYYHKSTFLAIDPFVGCEFALTQVLHLTLKLDNLLSVNRQGLGQPNGPRLYIGMMFCR